MKPSLNLVAVVLLLAALVGSVPVAPALAQPLANACAPTPLTGAAASTSSTGTGEAVVELDLKTRELKWNITFTGLTGPATAAHFHGPAFTGQNAGPVITITDLESPSVGSAILTSSQILQAASGQWYINFHTAAFGAGEIRGQVAPCMTGRALSSFALDGVQAGTPSAGAGSGMVMVDIPHRMLWYNISFQNLSGTPAAAHFHGAALEGQNAAPVITITDLTSPMEGMVTLTDTQLLYLLSHQLYVNIHTPDFGSGEIRGQVNAIRAADNSLIQPPFELNGAQAGTGSSSTGKGFVLLDPATRKITYTIGFNSFGSAVQTAHFHGPVLTGQNAPPVTPSIPITDLTSPIDGTATLTDAQFLQALNGEWYFNIHTADFPAGEIRGQVTSHVEGSTLCLTPFALDGEQAGTSAVGTGQGVVMIDATTGSMTYNFSFQGLSGAPTAAHFHGPAGPGQNAGPVVSITDLSSPMEGTTTLTPIQLAQIAAGKWYVNIHTAANGGGEIRGQVPGCVSSRIYLPGIMQAQ